MSRKAFPQAEIVSALEEWWADEKAEDALLKNDESPPPSTTSVMAPLVEIDSHRVVRALLTIEPLVGFEIPETVIRSGGYEDIADMTSDLVPRLQKLFEKKAAAHA